MLRTPLTAIISALPEEQAGLSSLLSKKELLPHVSRTFQRGLIHEKPVILALCGVGKVAAAMTATLLIERYGVQRIVFTGVAGGLGAAVKVGDVVVGSDYLQHDMDASPIFARYEIPYTGMSRFTADESLFATFLEATTAYSASIFQKNTFKIHPGLIVSGDRFVSSEAEATRLRKELPDVLCVEMEGAAMAQVCWSYKIPFAAVRTISDRADDAAHIDFPKFVSEVAAPYALGIVDELMRRL